MIESKKEKPLFRDPLAALLVGEHGNKVSNIMAPIAKYAYWSVTIRTCLVDECILKYIRQGCAIPVFPCRMVFFFKDAS